MTPLHTRWKRWFFILYFSAFFSTLIQYSHNLGILISGLVIYTLSSAYLYYSVLFKRGWKFLALQIFLCSLILANDCLSFFTKSGPIDWTQEILSAIFTIPAGYFLSSSWHLFKLNRFLSKSV